MSINSVVSILRTSLAVIDPGPSIPELANNQTLEGVVLAINGQNGVTIGFGSYRLKADVEGRLSLGDRVKLVVTEAGPPPQFKLLSVTGQGEAPALAGEALLPLLGQGELSTRLYAEVRRLLAQNGEAMPEAKELAAMLKPIPLDAPAGQLNEALAQQVAQSGIFLEGKLRRGVASNDAKALALKLLDRLAQQESADPAMVRVLRELVQRIEAQQARNVLSHHDTGQVTVPVPLLIGDQETETLLQFRFEDPAGDAASGPLHVSFLLDLSALRLLRVDLVLGRSHELAIDFRTQNDELATLIEGEATPLRDALTRAGFQVTRLAARAGQTAIEEPVKHGDAEKTPPPPVLINERA